MKRYAILLLPLLLTAGTGSLLAQSTVSPDARAVEDVLGRYKSAVERLDATGTETLFAPDSQIFESGSAEGSYANYLQHHLGPELAEFRAFRFSDYKLSVRFEGPVAIATETYRFTITPKQGEPIERQGVATSVLGKRDGRWQILSMHNSSRRPKPA
ncbi:nuclear transport factor 2 family protein [Sphingomonas canadensis]|uniref:Nuclear transport factor 2 family protein n=1 Tax=Sphingomonas canadensis TaxID=1219257 RepID=A0ABW3HCW6_9SPHN|nr:nuclear transport factor 2 family protein [Sphingomonas canadensis]MCW3837266.1 nuclear transport factor 2 family protein [Sphingomonas canadensis]